MDGKTVRAKRRRDRYEDKETTLVGNERPGRFTLRISKELDCETHCEKNVAMMHVETISETGGGVETVKLDHTKRNAA